MNSASGRSRSAYSISCSASAIAATRAVRDSALTVPPGIYSAALIGSASGRGYVVVAPDGQAFLFTATGTVVSARTAATRST